MIKYAHAYCAPFRQVVSVPQLQALLRDVNPLIKHLRFYCAEACCQASLLYTLSLDYFFMSQGARHARECPHFWSQTMTEENGI